VSDPATAQSRGPAPTQRLFLLAALGLIPAAASVAWSELAWAAAAWDLGVLLAAVIDFFQSPPAAAIVVERRVEAVISAGVRNRVEVKLSAAPGVRGRLRGELRDTPAPGPVAYGARAPFDFEGEATVVWQLVPRTRGDLAFGDLHVRLLGPLGLCARQVLVPAATHVKVYPDLSALHQDAIALARAADAPAQRLIRRAADGREFESLREYRPGDDVRTLDWKATARRGKAMVRQHQPERNQTVLLLIDCGRAMAGVVDGRRKLDHAVDAALKVARVSLDQGDLVGVMAVGQTVRAWLPPRRGSEQLRAITHALYKIEATLEETDWGQAFALAFSQKVRRSLVLLVTDLLDLDASRALVQRTRRLVPRHLPLVASLIDEDVAQAVAQVPASVGDAHRRQVAARLEDDVLRTVAQLRDAGARVVRTNAAGLGPGAVNAYLDVKARGLL
jgi:uncharacterized protein (DUF58 family)